MSLGSCRLWHLIKKNQSYICILTKSDWNLKILKIPFAIASHKMKYCNITKGMKDLYAKNYKTLI